MKQILLAGIAVVGMVAAASGASAATVMTGTLGQIAAGSTLYADYDTKNPTISGGLLEVSPSTGLPGLAAPVGSGNFAYVTGDSSVSYTFAAPTNVFSLDVGSIDPYNYFNLSFANGPSQTFGGGQGFFSQFSQSQSARIVFTADAGQQITGVTLFSTANSLEFDNLAVGTGAVPEPATWAMMMLGFGMIGFGLRRRSKVSTTVRFA